MNRNRLMALGALPVLLGLAALNISNAENADAATAKAAASGTEKSVAWYVANAKEARDQNKECHDNPGIQSTPNCVNSLHALQISFAGGSGRR